MEYNPEKVLEAYENRLKRHGLHLGRRQWGILEKVLQECWVSEDNSHATNTPIDMEVLKSVSPAGRKGTHVITALMHQRRRELEKERGMTVTQSYDAALNEMTDEYALKFYREYCEGNRSFYSPSQLGKKTVDVLKAYLVKRGLIEAKP